MKALGMIEVYGYLAAVEALDSALKAANVRKVDVTLVQGGLVAVLITGDVGAVKAAIDAAKTAAERLGRVISVHVIPRPSDQIEMLIPTCPTDAPPSPKKPEKIPEQGTQIPDDGTDLQVETVAGNEEPQAEAAPVSAVMSKEPDRIAADQLKEMTVERLRSLAREIGITTMTRKEIRFATKHELIDEISKFIEQER